MKVVLTWQSYLTSAEAAELEKITADKRAGQAHARQIYDRCRKRRAKANESGPVKTGEN